jgi:hypothetical protein
MNVNRKIRPIETIPGIGGRRINENLEGMNSTMIQCKNFCKCHNVPPSTTIILKKKFLKSAKKAVSREQGLYLLHS